MLFFIGLIIGLVVGFGVGYLYLAEKVTRGFFGG